MRQINLGKSGLIAPEIALGCMRMRDLSVEDACGVLRAALDSGMNFFDHADIYRSPQGVAEEIFGRAVKQMGLPRNAITIQTKCGIHRVGHPQKVMAYEFTTKHIMDGVEGSLKRLQTDYVDLFALHRPDTLMEPEEVAEIFETLYAAGKVRYFGVSNFTPGQMELIQKYTGHKLIVNQLQFSLVHTGMIDAGFNANTRRPGSIDHDGGILDYCRLKDVTIQAWTPFRAAVSTGGTFLDHPDYPELGAKLGALAEQYDVSREAIAAAWILRHPAQIQVIIGSMNPERIQRIAKAAEIRLTHAEWYELYLAAGNTLP